MSKIVEIVLHGSIVSKKNSRINTASGRSFVSKEFAQWQNDAIWEVRQQTRHRFLKPVSVDVICIFGKKTVSDLDNRLTSILDMLKEAFVIRDDRWEYIPKVSVAARYIKGAKNGAIIRITEVEPVA